MAQDLDLFNPGRVQRENALDADAVGNLAHGEGGAVASAVDLDDDALEGLDTLFFALSHFDLEARCVADATDRAVLAW